MISLYSQLHFFKEQKNLLILPGSYSFFEKFDNLYRVNVWKGEYHLFQNLKKFMHKNSISLDCSRKRSFIKNSNFSSDWSELRPKKVNEIDSFDFWILKVNGKFEKKDLSNMTEMSTTLYRTTYLNSNYGINFPFQC